MPKGLTCAIVIAAALMLLFAGWHISQPASQPAIRERAAITPPPLPTCTEAEIDAAFAALPDYQPSGLTDFVRVRGDQFWLGDEPFFARGVNYYPARYPWRRFLTQTDPETVATEFALLQSVEFNTLRLFLWNEALFTCPGSGAVPVAEAFLRLDGIVQMAAANGFRLIVTLNDLPDLMNYPLYHNPPHTLAQTEFIVQRYRDEAAIFAWDLRNEGDIDYGSHPTIQGTFHRATVLAWLDRTAARVRSLDTNHLITAGWLYDSESTIPYVDFVSFHHWSGVGRARQRVKALRTATDKPVLLQEFGYSSQRVGLEAQAFITGEVIAVVETAGAAGWLIWAAFDFPTDATCTPPHCPSEDNAEHHFGVWAADYTPKPVIDVLKPE